MPRIGVLPPVEGRPIMEALAQEGQAVDATSRGLRVFPGLRGREPNDDWGLGYHQPAWVLAAKDRFKGERCFIFGTGPSLTAQLPLLHHMRQEYTWTVNRMSRWKDLPFIPTNHCFTEPGPVEEWGARVHPAYDFAEAQNRIAIHWFPVTAPGWLWVAKAPDDIQMRWEGFFGLGNYLPPLPSGWASPLTLCQLAAWMGFQEFYFLGIDTTQEGQAWDPVLGRTLRKRNILAIEECFDRARAQIEKAGRRIVDCTPGGLINADSVLPYRELAEVLSAPRPA